MQVNLNEQKVSRAEFTKHFSTLPCVLFTNHVKFNQPLKCATLSVMCMQKRNLCSAQIYLISTIS